MEATKIIGVGIIALIIIVIIKQYKPEFAIYVSLISGIIIIFLVFNKLAGILNLLTVLSKKTGMNATYLSIILKITGIAILTEFGVSICKDAGEVAIASKIEFGGKIIIMSISIPIISALLEVITTIIP
jgi:stage III sporulation protein AD